MTDEVYDSVGRESAQCKRPWCSSVAWVFSHITRRCSGRDSNDARFMPQFAVR